MIDNIEMNINEADKKIRTASNKLDKGKKHHISAKKKTCCLIITGLIIIAVITGAFSWLIWT